ncbi:MAG: 8-oxo-dGTP diphosphatase [Patescibacteria group bacterium]
MHPIEAQVAEYFSKGKRARPALTLAMVLDTAGERILLGLKKRKLGAGYYNGFGGVVEVGESVEDAAKRELFEESGLTYQTGHYSGLLEIVYKDWNERIFIYIFTVTATTGEPIETEEMTPAWFPLTAIPYPQMWPDDHFWLPLLLVGQEFHVRCTYEKGLFETPQLCLISSHAPVLPAVSP